MRSLTPILEEGVFSLRFGSIGADVAEESFSLMGYNNLKPTTGLTGIPMPCSVPASLSPTPVSRRNSNPVGPSAGRQSSPSSVVVGVNLNLDDGDDFRPARFQAHRRLDRCLSEPTTTAAAQSRSNSRSNSGAGTNSNSSRYKTELCRAFEETGHCKYGEKCQFAHGHQELRTIHRHRKYKTELCRTYHTIGFCPYGPRCHFIHNAEEARMSKQSQPPRPLSMSSSSSSSNSSPTHTDSLSGSPTSSSFTMFWAPGDEERLRLDSPPSAASYRCINNNCVDLDMFVKPGVPVVEFPDFMVTGPGSNNGVNVNVINNHHHHHTNMNNNNNNNNNVMAPRLPVFSRLAGTDADPADR